MIGTPYLASEDSALLRRALEGRKGTCCLEIGAGNGGTLVSLSRSFRTAVGTDLQRPEMQDWRAGANFVLADRAACFRDGTFDLVAFNPPYLPGEGVGDPTVDGGRRLQVPASFLEEALRVVDKGGSVVFLLNHEADVTEFEGICAKRGFRLRPLASERLFFEALSVYEATYAEGVPRRDRTGHVETTTARRLHHVPASPS